MQDKIKLTVDPRILKDEYEQYKWSKSSRNDALKFAEDDEKAYLKAVSLGYNGPKRKIDIPTVYKPNYQDSLGLAGSIPMSIGTGLGDIGGAANIRGDYKVRLQGDTPLGDGTLKGHAEIAKGIYTVPEDMGYYAPNKQKSASLGLAYSNGPHSVILDHGKVNDQQTTKAQYVYEW